MQKWSAFCLYIECILFTEEMFYIVLFSYVYALSHTSYDSESLALNSTYITSYFSLEVNKIEVFLK